MNRILRVLSFQLCGPGYRVIFASTKSEEIWLEIPVTMLAVVEETIEDHVTTYVTGLVWDRDLAEFVPAAGFEGYRGTYPESEAYEPPEHFEPNESGVFVVVGRGSSMASLWRRCKVSPTRSPSAPRAST